jgi:hypothetical protein
MSRRLLLPALVCILAFAQVALLSAAAEQRKSLPLGDGYASILPGPILKLTAVEFDGLFSDLFFLRSMVFFGGTLERTEQPRVKDWEWRWLGQMLKASTDLDPYFLDPYYFANAHLTWEGGLVEEVNALLDQGLSHRHWDWALPFYKGFNHFYFLQEHDLAAQALMEGARRPGASPFLARLATRLAYQGRHTENAILFLEEMLKGTDDLVIQRNYEIRLEALQGILVLERAVEMYRTTFGGYPQNLQALIREKLIPYLP